jgi:hypothetical protein
MPQVFHRSFNTISKASLLALAVLGVVSTWLLYVVGWSPYVSQANLTRVQPVPFSHQHHVGELGIDCRYCHSTVEYSAFAGIPPTKTCMNCHQEIWFGSAILEPVRASYRGGESIPWERVHNLPQFVYFDHHIHINKGVGCITCHGRIDQMPFTYQDKSLFMDWCVSCHRDPRPNLRPREYIFSMNWQPPNDEPDLGDSLFQSYQIQGADQLMSCSTCHR